MRNHGSHPLLVDGVEHVEEVGTIRELAFRELGGEVDGDVWVTFELRVKVRDGDFVVFGRIDPLHLRQLEELLLAGEDIAEEVLVRAGVGRDVEPDSIRIRDDIELTGAIP